MQPFEQEQTTLTKSAFDDPSILSGQFWGELRVFLAVAKAKSFNKAADILNTSHPTVSRQVKRLQDMMGSQLFVPTKSGVRLTPKGEELARSLINLDQSLFSLTNDLKAESRDTEGLVRISITDGLNTAFLTPNLPSFTSNYPRIQMSLKAPQNVNSLRENQTDIMIGFSVPTAADVSYKQLGYLHFIPVASREYVRQNGLPSRANIHQHFFVHSEYYTAKTGLWDRWHNIIHLGQIVHLCENPVSYAMMTKAGVGIGLLASYTTLDPQLIPLDLDIHVAVPIYAIALAERLQARPVRITYDWLCDMLSTQNPWLAREMVLGILPNDYDLGFRLTFNI
ncbi:LysR family transcriptional regulator [Oryzibacter oryziterrae]|uniref:LysR family transcriptional regulator n=1 Tax=Oryzibacter oryziterrae TaxID=2766474 RepID=UPI001F21F2DC|nr:LysR family transcriptional regulator [Oryzibacter oryziterrae]